MKFHLPAAVLALALIASACSSDSTSVSITGEAEANTESADVPARILSLNPTGTEMLFAVGAGDQVIAVDSFSYYPPEAPVTELSAFTPNVEAIGEFEPDLIVTQGPIEGLDALGVDILELSAAATLDDIYSQIEQVGAITGNVGQAAELVGEMQIDIDRVLESIPDREVPLTYYHELDDTLFSVTSSTFVGYIYGLLGLQNVADAADPDGAAFGYPQLNEEFVVSADPDIIFLADTLSGQSAETVAARPGWEQLNAVEEGNIVELNDDIVSRWGPRIVEFIEVAGAAVAEFDTVAAS